MIGSCENLRRNTPTFPRALFVLSLGMVFWGEHFYNNLKWGKPSTRLCVNYRASFLPVQDYWQFFTPPTHTGLGHISVGKAALWLFDFESRSSVCFVNAGDSYLAPLLYGLISYRGTNPSFQGAGNTYDIDRMTPYMGSGVGSLYM